MARKLPRGIDRRTDGLYRARVFYKGRQYSLGSFFTITDAKAALAIARSEMARQVFIPPSERNRAVADAALADRIAAVTVAEWADDWIDRLESAGKAPATTRSYRSTLNVHVLPHIGDRRLIDVTPEDIDAMLDKVPSRGAWTNAARTVRSLFLAAISAGVGGLAASPVRVSVPKVRAGERVDSEDIATPGDVRAIAAAMPEHLRIAVPLAAWCALRLGEVLGLQRRDLEHLDDPSRAVLHVRRQWNSKASPPGYTDPKAGSKRSIAIPAVLLDDLRAHVDRLAGPGREGPLMPSSRDPRVPVSQTAFDKAWRTAREDARPGFRFHSLRHTGLTEFARAGATLAELKHRGGHKDIETAARYQHSTAERDRTLTERMNNTVKEA